jgi:hypothetical protein
MTEYYMICCSSRCQLVTECQGNSRTHFLATSRSLGRRRPHLELAEYCGTPTNTEAKGGGSELLSSRADELYEIFHLDAERFIKVR